MAYILSYGANKMKIIDIFRLRFVKIKFINGTCIWGVSNNTDCLMKQVEEIEQRTKNGKASLTIKKGE